MKVSVTQGPCGSDIPVRQRVRDGNKSVAHLSEMAKVGSRLRSKGVGQECPTHTGPAATRASAQEVSVCRGGCPHLPPGRGRPGLRGQEGYALSSTYAI